MKIIVGISGASGIQYGIRILEILKKYSEYQAHLILSTAAERVLNIETEYTEETVYELADVHYSYSDIAAPIASGSFKANSMIVAPCSMKTLSGIAYSYAENLLVRAADVTLKEKRPLLLMPRETPLHLGHIKMMARAAEIGCIMMPPIPSFYFRPTSIAQIIDHTVYRALELVGVEFPQGEIPYRWEGPIEDLL